MDLPIDSMVDLSSSLCGCLPDTTIGWIQFRLVVGLKLHDALRETHRCTLLPNAGLLWKSDFCTSPLRITLPLDPAMVPFKNLKMAFVGEIRN